MSAQIGQNRIRAGWWVQKQQKMSDIIYVRSLGILLVNLFCSLIHTKLTFNSMRMRQQQKIGFGNTEEQIVELACEKFERLIVGHPVRYLLGIPSVHCTVHHQDDVRRQKIPPGRSIQFVTNLNVYIRLNLKIVVQCFNEFFFHEFFRYVKPSLHPA